MTKLLSNHLAENQMVDDRFIPDETVPRVAMFNRHSGVLVTIMEDLNLESLGSKDIYAYERVILNPRRQTVVGEWPDHQVMNIQDIKPEKYERELNIACDARINSHYPIDKRLNIVEKALVKLLELVADRIDPTILQEKDIEDLMEASAFINEVRQSNDIRKAAYAANPLYNYISLQDEIKHTEKQMEGGVHAKHHGPRKLN